MRPSATGSVDLAPIDWTFVAIAAILLGHALQISSGFYEPAALALAIASALCCAAALLRLPGRLLPHAGERTLAIVLLLGVLSNIASLALSRPAFYLREQYWPPSPVFYVAIAAAGLAAVLIFAEKTRALRVWFVAAAAASGVLGLWLIRASPHPRIDVLTVYSAALYSLREGHSPYSVSFTNVYGHTGYYGAGTASGTEVQFGFPYPPLALLMALPGRAFGDIRYAELAALITGAVYMARAGGGRIGPLAAMTLLFSPRTLFVLEQGWSEPFVILWLGVLVFAATRDRPLAMPLGLLVAVKQHLAVALLFAPWLERRNASARPRTLIAKSTAIAALITLPFFLWDPSGFWRSVVALQFNEPFRIDSLSVVAALGQRGWTPSSMLLVAISAAALAVALLVAWRFAPRTPAGFAVSVGFVLLLLFLFSKKAFCNYYYLVIAAFAASVSAQAAAEGECGTRSSTAM